jgi:hypothetical protein
VSAPWCIELDEDVWESGEDGREIVIGEDEDILFLGVGGGEED